ncbi:MAG: arsenate reductase [Actinobacteria bacterium]|nr:arsenate reductase [Actinomycetota bacterium]
MAEVTILHNKNCGSSRNSLEIVEGSGLDYEVIEYLKDKPDREFLERIVTILDGPVEDLVRKDARFAKLGLDADDYTTPEAVVDLLVNETALLQRPIVIRGDKAVIGRPKERVADLLAT